MRAAPRNPDWQRFALAALILAAGAAGGALAQAPAGPPQRGIASGPDVTVWTFFDGVQHYGEVANVHAYAIGSESCNQGDEPVNWCNDGGDAGCGMGTTDSDHPVIAQNIHRVKNGRYEQIGMSWLKHGFLALQGSAPGCGDGSCDPPPLGGDQLGVGCVDPYDTGLNGSRPLGMRSEVNAASGAFPYPYTQVAWDDLADQRVQIREEDLDPALNPGARYFAEAQYVAPDDAAAENGLNNATYREVLVQPDFSMDETGAFHREQSAIYAWQLVHPDVEIVNVDVPGSVPVERFEAGQRVTQLADGQTWHYEIALRNMNSDRSGRALTVAFPPGTAIGGAGFHDVDHHSGEPYSTADWTVAINNGTIRWQTEAHSTNPNANALRWATAFSFWFDAAAPPQEAGYSLELFKPGIPGSVTIPFGGLLFEDGFESGDTGAWDSQAL